MPPERPLTNSASETAGTFVDLFAGCGGLSLGLMNAGWTGVFAVERESNAFATLRHNLIDGSAVKTSSRFDWPSWLPIQEHEVGALARKYEKQLRGMQGTVDLVAGGPPCQGFSFAGRREKSDNRNVLFRKYLRVVDLLRPRFLLIENVRGIAIGFGKPAAKGTKRNRKAKPFATRITQTLERRLGYKVFTGILRAVDVGIPQLRPRFIMLGVRADLLESVDSLPLEEIRGIRELFLAAKGLNGDREVSAYEAISDLETKGAQLEECEDSPGFLAASYAGPRTSYQRLLHRGLNGTAPNSRRLVKHQEETRRRFELALEQSRRGVTLSSSEKKELGIMRKHHFVILEKLKPSHTLTTLPDDLLHYSEPRVLTVREYARLQSFPDWFEFKGKYTTGGLNRKHEVPRYSQVANAVPPLMAEFLGFLLEVFSLRLDKGDDGVPATVSRSPERQAPKPPSPEPSRIFEYLAPQASLSSGRDDALISAYSAR